MTAKEYISTYEKDLMQREDVDVFLDALQSVLNGLTNELAEEIKAKEPSMGELKKLINEKSKKYDEIVDGLTEKYGSSPLRKGRYWGYIQKTLRRGFKTIEEKDLGEEPIDILGGENGN